MPDANAQNTLLGERIPRSSLSGTQDLLGAFDLIGLYNQLVKPYAKSNVSSKPGLQSDIKGKGKAVDPGPTQQPEPDGETPGTAKKLPRGYLHHVADLPGESVRSLVPRQV